MLKDARTKKRFLQISLFFCLLGGMFAIQGCGGGGGNDPEPPPPRLATIEGYAYFPSYVPGESDPSYYSDGNFGIQIALHADDGTPIVIQTTGDSGFYRFDNVPQGYYFVTAFAEEYHEAEDLYYTYEAESPDIDIVGDEIVEVDLYLTYAGAT